MNAEATRFIRITKSYAWVLLIGANAFLLMFLFVEWTKSPSSVARQVRVLFSTHSSAIQFR